MPSHFSSYRASSLAAIGTLLSAGMIIFGFFSGRYLPESTAESFIFLSPLPLAFTMIGLHTLYRNRKGNTAVFAAGALGVMTLTLSVIISIWSPAPLFTDPWYAVLTTTLISGTAVWVMGINGLGLRHKTFPLFLCLIGLIAGVSWLILVISSVSLWQPYIPFWLLNLNLLIWIPTHMTWLIWMTITLVNTGRSGMLPTERQAFS